MFKFEGPYFCAEVATVWELAELPPHVKHVHVKFLDNAIRSPEIRERLPSKIGTFNFESLRIDDFAEKGVWNLDFKCFFRGCFQKLRVLHVGRFSLSIADSIRAYHWRQLRELRVDSFVVIAHITFLGLFSENFPRLVRIYICSSCYKNSNTADPVFKKVFEHAEIRKQVATTTFLVMRHFLPAELAFMIAEEAAFGPPLRRFRPNNKKLKH